MNKVTSLIFCFIFLLCSFAYTQPDKRKPRLSAVGGIAFRTTIMQNFKLEGPRIPVFGDYFDYLYEKNIQGISYQAGMKLKMPSLKLNVTYALGIRHDHVNRRNSDSRYQESWLFDHHIMLMRSFKHEKHRLGLGYSIVNLGESYIDYEGIKKHIDFINYNLIYQRRVWRDIYAQFNVLYIPKGQYPADTSQDFLSYSIGLFYELNLSKSP